MYKHVRLATAHCTTELQTSAFTPESPFTSNVVVGVGSSELEPKEGEPAVLKGLRRGRSRSGVEGLEQRGADSGDPAEVGGWGAGRWEKPGQ